MSTLTNQQIAHTLEEMAALYEMQDVRYKPRAYERAAANVQSHQEPLRDIYRRDGVKGLQDISGVGQAIAEHIESILKGEHFQEYETLKEQVPVDVQSIVQVEGVGPRTVKTLYQELGITTLDDLEAAAREGKIRQLEGFGKKSEANILQGIEFLRQSGQRRVLGFIYDELEQLVSTIGEFQHVDRAALAGSARRMQETIGDIDILVTSSKPADVMQEFVQLPHIDHVYGQGDTKANVRLASEIDADVRVVPAKSWGAALNYFTGSKAHNIALRKRAQRQGWKLSEYGLFDGKQQLAGATETELYQQLDLAYVEPELREDRGEIAAAERQAQGQSDGLPDLIGYDDLRGDLQIQTDWTDGKDSIEDMAAAAAAAGLEYIVITDHTKSLAMTGGADEQQLLEQMEYIDGLNKKQSDCQILKGAEVNILKDGTLDIADEVLAQLDVVGAAIHSHFDLNRREQTRRLQRAMENKHVDIIFHLTTRRINKRKMIAHDIDRIIRTAQETKTVLEIDAFPDRLDINDEYVRKCVEAGVKMAIDSDAHAQSHYDFLRFGIAQARRGWASRDDIINAHPADQMLQMLKQG